MLNEETRIFETLLDTQRTLKNLYPITVSNDLASSIYMCSWLQGQTRTHAIELLCCKQLAKVVASNACMLSTSQESLCSLLKLAATKTHARALAFLSTPLILQSSERIERTLNCTLSESSNAAKWKSPLTKLVCILTFQLTPSPIEILNLVFGSVVRSDIRRCDDLHACAVENPIDIMLVVDIIVIVSECIVLVWPAIGCSAASATLAGFCIWFTWMLYGNYRTNDFVTASEKAVVRTCIEAVTIQQINSTGINTAEWECSDTEKSQLASLLSVSVHAMYAANKKSAYIGDGKATFDSIVLAVQGIASNYAIERKGAYAALSVLGTPSTTDCDVLYPDAVENKKTVTPLVPDVVCNANTLASNNAPELTFDKNKLYTHCLAQFRYGASWPAAGTFGIPKVGEEAKPVLFPLPTVNSTTPWNERQRILVGSRWGYSTVGYIFFVLTSSFFLMDSTILLLAELTRVDAYNAQNAISAGNAASMREGMMTMLATFQAKRDLRWIVALLLVFLEIIIWVVFIGLPWGWGESLGRPICETGEAEHWISPFTLTTLAGWKKDYDTFYIEIAIMLSHIIIAVVVPISTIFPRAGSGKGNTVSSGRTSLANSVRSGFTGVAASSLRSSYWFISLSLGAVTIYCGQALVLFTFGVYWAEGITFQKWNSIALGVMIHDHVQALLYLTITVGLSLGSVVGRWVLAGLSCTSLIIFIMWVLITLAGFAPILFVSAYWMFWSLEGGKEKENCAVIFGSNDGEYVYGKTACEISMWTYIIGIILVLISIVGPIVLGLIDYSRVACLPRRRAWVEAPAYWKELTRPVATTSQNASDAMPLFTDAVETGMGYRSANTSHFNWKVDEVEDVEISRLVE